MHHRANLVQELFISYYAYLSKTCLLWNYENTIWNIWPAWSLPIGRIICEFVILLVQVLQVYFNILKKKLLCMFYIKLEAASESGGYNLHLLQFIASACWPCSTVLFVVMVCSHWATPRTIHVARPMKWLKLANGISGRVLVQCEVLCILPWNP